MPFVLHLNLIALLRGNGRDSSDGGKWGKWKGETQAEPVADQIRV